jgi:hypothetical protein
MKGKNGWLKGQMKTAKATVDDWQGWKKDTIRSQISEGLSSDRRGQFVSVRSAETGRLVIKSRKK